MLPQFSKATTASDREHLIVAFASAWPLGSEASYRLATRVLDQRADGVLTAKTEKLAGELESWVVTRARGLGVDALAHARDYAWFDDVPFDGQQRSVSIIQHLKRVAARYLTADGCRILLRSDVDTPHLARRWRWISLLFPHDLFPAILADGEPVADHVTLVGPFVESILANGVAETHHHVGAALNFSMLWAALMRDLATDDFDSSTLNRAGPSPFNSADTFLRLLLTSAIVRLLLAAHLRNIEHGVAIGDFRTQACIRLRTVLAQRLSRASPWSVLSILEPSLRAFETGGTPPARAHELAHVYRRLFKPVSRLPRDVPEIYAQDPLSAWLERSNAAPETRFMARAIAHAARGVDATFETYFYQYLRIRFSLHRHLTQEPGTSGLGWFVRYFRRIGPVRRRINPALFDTSYETHARDIVLRASEPRTSPSRSWTQNRDMAREVLRQSHGRADRCRDTQVPESALVLHFVKEARDSTGPRTAHGYPSAPLFSRFGHWFVEREREALAIESALRFNPELLIAFRALDVAGEELAMPLWPFIPLIRRCRAASRRASAFISARKRGWRVPPLRLTYHAGEDYRRLTEGVRRMYELVEFRILERGDRIGHGIALGDDPERRIGRRALQPREERLDDLLFELSLYRRGVIECADGRVSHVESEAVSHGQAILDRRPSITELLALRESKHDASRLSQTGFPRMDSIRRRSTSEDVKPLVDYLTNLRAWQMGQVPIESEMTPGEAKFLKQAQRELRRQLSRLEVTIETNPSSNLLIGDFQSVDDHPVFRLHPRRMDSSADPAMLVSINSDDPLTFATSIGDEFVHTYHALLRSDVPSEEALEWLERVRSFGWRSRFSLPMSADPKVAAFVIRGG